VRIAEELDRLLDQHRLAHMRREIVFDRILRERDKVFARLGATLLQGQLELRLDWALEARQAPVARRPRLASDASTDGNPPPEVVDVDGGLDVERLLFLGRVQQLEVRRAAYRVPAQRQG